MKRFIPMLVMGVALAAPASALARGVVLKVERASHVVAVATSARDVVLVHTAAASRLRTGELVTMRTHRLRNGTFAAAGVRVVGRASRVRFRGFVLSRHAASRRMTLSAGGLPLTVATTSTAQPGSEVDVDAQIEDDGELDADGVNVVSATAPGGSLEGHLLAIGAGSIIVGSEHEVLVIGVPAGIDLSGFAVGDEVLAVFSQQSDGSLLLTSLSRDENAQAANEDDQGNQGDDGDNGDHGGDGGDG
jgi:hypothetical protein